MDPELPSFGIGIPNCCWVIHSSLIPQGATSSKQNCCPNIMRPKPGLRYMGRQYPLIQPQDKIVKLSKEQPFFVQTSTLWRAPLPRGWDSLL